MRRLLLTVVCLLAFAGVAVAEPPATITEVTEDSLKVGGLDCGTPYEIRVREFRSGAWRDSRTYTATTAACAAPPTAGFDWSPADPADPPVAVDFTFTGTCQATPCSYSWDHAGAVFATTRDASFTYQAAGTKTVTVTVTDAQNRSATITRSFQVAASPPPPPPAKCGNGLDDDGDQLVDLNDPGCTSSSDDDESNVVEPPPPTGGCDSTVSTAAQVDSAARSVANEGKVVCVADGNYGNFDLFNFNHPVKVTLRALNPHQAVVGSIKLNNVHGLRWENFRHTGTVHNSQGIARRIEVVGGDIGGTASTAFLMSDNAHDWLVERNRIHDITFNGSFGSGYGMYAYGGVPKTGLKVRYNTFERTQVDAMELGNIDTFEIVGNDVHHINWTGDPGSDPHADALMIWADSRNGLIKDNRFTDGNGVLLSRVYDTRIENNLIANIENWCFQNGYAERQTIVRNTVYDCGSDYSGGGMGGGYGMTLDQASATGNVLQRNLLTSVGWSSNAIASSDHNLITNGSRPGSTDLQFTPVFADTVDWQATNEPAGYEDVGYRPAPAGHLAP
jgi:PKD repeat protein